MYRRLSFFTILFLLLIAVSGFSEIPGSMNYQGYITDSAGDPVSDGNYLIQFAIYDAPAGGTQLWNSGFQNLSVEDGLVTYKLGSNFPFPSGLFQDTTLYLGITVGVDPELTPRNQLVTVPFAFHASRSDTAGYSESSTGVVQNFEDGSIIVSGFLNYIGFDSINCPADGYVMVNLTTTLNCNHSSGDEDVLFVLLTDSTGTVTTDQDNSAWVVNTALPTGPYGTIVQKHKVFQVSAGWNRFQALGSQNPGGGTDNFASSDVVFSLLFIPKALGDISKSQSMTPSPHFKDMRILNNSR